MSLNIDEYLEFETNVRTLISFGDSSNVTMRDMFTPFVTDTRLNMVKYKELYHLVVEEDVPLPYIYTLPLDRTNRDIVTNIQCDQEANIVGHYTDIIKRDVRYVTLPLFYSMNSSFELRIILRSRSCSVSYDVYLLNLPKRRVLTRMNTITNNTGMVFSDFTWTTILDVVYSDDEEEEKDAKSVEENCCLEFT